MGKLCSSIEALVAVCIIAVLSKSAELMFLDINTRKDPAIAETEKWRETENTAGVHFDVPSLSDIPRTYNRHCFSLPLLAATQVYHENTYTEATWV